MIKKNYFSIIIPVFNGQDFIKECIESVLLQTYKKYEILIVNDCSTDSTLELLKEYKKNKKIKIICNKKNLGISKSRNIGLKQASGNFISFIDADDVWEKDMLFEHFKCYEKGMDLVYTSYKRFGENKKEFIVISPKRLTLNMMMYSNFIPNSSASYNRKTLGLHFHTDLVRVCEDYIYWIEIFKKKPKNIGIQKILLRYRVHSNSMSSNKINTMKAVWKIHNEYLHQNFFLTSFYMFFWVFFAFKKRLF